MAVGYAGFDRLSGSLGSFLMREYRPEALPGSMDFQGSLSRERYR